MRNEMPVMGSTAAVPQPPVCWQHNFEPLLNVRKAAELLGGIHPKTLMRMARNGGVPARQVGRSWFFRASELNDWLSVQSTRQPVRVI